MLRDLRGDQEDFPPSVRGSEYTSRTSWLTPAIEGLQERIADLAKQKLELTLQEKMTERTTLGTEEVVLSDISLGTNT